MKIQEIIETANAKVSRVQGNKVTIDHGDGTETTIDTNKNPDALDQDEQGNVTVDTRPRNSRMRTGNRRQQVRPGQNVKVQSNS